MRAKNKRITIQQQSTTQDDYGQPLDTWTDVAANIYASIEPLTGRDFFAAKQINSEITTRITINYRNDILPKMRVVYGSKIYDIIAPPIDFEERHIEIHLMCRELM